MASKFASSLVFLILSCVFIVCNSLQCYQCGQYNDGVGSITPCLNYSEQSAHLLLKDCPRASDKYCIKYVSELSVVRDCVAECAEKEVWETRTFCCNTDACNDGTSQRYTTTALMMTLLLPLVFSLIFIGRH